MGGDLDLAELWVCGHESPGGDDAVDGAQVGLRGGHHDVRVGAAAVVDLAVRLVLQQTPRGAKDVRRNRGWEGKRRPHVWMAVQRALFSLLPGHFPLPPARSVLYV